MKGSLIFRYYDFRKKKGPIMVSIITTATMVFRIITYLLPNIDLAPFFCFSLSELTILSSLTVNFVYEFLKATLIFGPINRLGR